MRSRVYVDTSAYLCLLLGEDGAPAVATALENARLHSSVLLVLETRRNLVRLARNGKLAPATLLDLLDRVQHDMAPAVATSRSLDLAHLRTALWFHRIEPLHRFVTRDEGQREAARELGLATS